MNLDDVIGEPYRLLLTTLGSDVQAIAQERPGQTFSASESGVLRAVGESVLIGGATSDGWTDFLVQFGIANDGHAYAWTAINAHTIDDTTYETYALFRLTTAIYADLHEQAIVQAQAREADARNQAQMTSKDDGKQRRSYAVWSDPRTMSHRCIFI